MNEVLESRMHGLIIAHKELKVTLRAHQSEHVLRFGEFGVMASIIGTAKMNGEPPVGTGVPMKMLPADRNCTPAMITKLITGLEERGFVKRELSTDDRRGVKVCVTQKGYEVWQADHEQNCRMLEMIGEKMGMDNLMTLFDLAEEFTRCSKQIIEEKEKKESNDG